MGPGDGNRELKATASQRCGVGRKPEAKLGADEQEPDIRPAWWGNPAMDGAPESHPDTHAGKSGSARAKQQRLTLGDLPASPDDPEQGAGDGVRRVGRSQPRS